MNRLTSLLLHTLSVIYLIGLTACDSKKEGQPQNFDRRGLLENIANNLITPAFDSLYNEAKRLQKATQSFVDAPSLSTLESLQAQWKQTYTVWQSANMYNFDFLIEPNTFDKSLFEEIGVFPADSNLIEQYISQGNYSFANFQRNTRGFLAMDYLLFRTDGNQQAIVDAFINNSNRRLYLKAVAYHLLLKIEQTRARWRERKASFIANDGTGAGSSLNLLFNEFNLGYERIKNFKLGIPLGKKAPMTSPAPMYVEAYYSGVSIEMIRANMKAIENIWRGVGANGQDGLGFQDYLLAVAGGKELSDNTEAQLAVIYQKLDALDSQARLSTLIETQYTTVVALHTEMLKHTRYFKSDMSSLLGLYITYDSGDGD
jgi:predicted lipoprotein